MANPSKQKGTAGETELRLELLGRGIEVVRNPPSARADLSTPPSKFPRLFALATRPDRGQWLVTVDLDTFAELAQGYALDIEVKRYSKFSHHTLYEGKKPR